MTACVANPLRCGPWPTTAGVAPTPEVQVSTSAFWPFACASPLTADLHEPCLARGKMPQPESERGRQPRPRFPQGPRREDGGRAAARAAGERRWLRQSRAAGHRRQGQSPDHGSTIEVQPGLEPAASPAGTFHIRPLATRSHGLQRTARIGQHRKSEAECRLPDRLLPLHL